MPKYIGRQILNNEEDQYQDLFEPRDINLAQHYETLIFNESNFDSSYPSIEHIWKRGDKLYKLSYEYYGTYKYWWVIALYNNKPTDAHYSDGDILDVPIDPSQVETDITG